MYWTLVCSVRWPRVFMHRHTVARDRHWLLLHPCMGLVGWVVSELSALATHTHTNDCVKPTVRKNNGVIIINTKAMYTDTRSDRRRWGVQIDMALCHEHLYLVYSPGTTLLVLLWVIVLIIQCVGLTCDCYSAPQQTSQPVAHICGPHWH
jgi:hypothetical protein